MDQRTASPTPGFAGSEEHLRSILATVPDAMIIIDERGTIVSFSTAAEKMFGYTEAELIGENVSMLMPSPDRERHDSYLEEYCRTGVRKIIGIGRVTTGRRRDGNTFPMELSVGEAWVDGSRRKHDCRICRPNSLISDASARWRHSLRRLRMNSTSL